MYIRSGAGSKEILGAEDIRCTGTGIAKCLQDTSPGQDIFPQRDAEEAGLETLLEKNGQGAGEAWHCGDIIKRRLLDAVDRPELA